jgi:hypothetical protein
MVIAEPTDLVREQQQICQTMLADRADFVSGTLEHGV